MSIVTDVVAFTAAATLLTITPGLDTALVLRTTLAEGRRRAMLAGLGIVTGCFVWGVAVATGSGVLATVSSRAYDILRWAGAAYLFHLGFRLLLSSASAPVEAGDGGGRRPDSSCQAFVRGLLTNLLNPKVGVFYVSFVPQFVPRSADVTLMTASLAAIHAMLGLGWFAVIAFAGDRFSRLFRRRSTMRWLDRSTGCLFLFFGARLALSPRS